MPRKNNKLSKILGIEEEKPVEAEKPKQLPVISSAQQPSPNDENDDYSLTRSTLRNLIFKGEGSLDDLLMVAKDSESARAYEVVAKMMQAISEISGNLSDLHERSRNRRVPPENQSNIQVDKAIVFQGTAADLLSAINKKEKK